jgi:hypothetical protein
MPSGVKKESGLTKNRENDPRKTSSSEVIKRTRQVMKLYHSEEPEHWVPEMTKLLDDLGIDFVCQHACRAETYGRGACCEGHCAHPIDGAEDCTCRQAMFYNVDCYVGFSSDKEGKAAMASMYAQVRGKKRKSSRAT